MRRFPAPWTIEQIPGGYKVLDATGQSLAYVYGRETKADADTANVLTMDEAHARDHPPRDGMLRKVGMSRIPFFYGRKCEVIEWREHQTTMSQYEADVIKLLTQIMDELQRIRIRLEERDRIQEEENEDLLKRIEKTHRGPTSE